MAEVETSEKIEKSSILLAVSFFDSHGKVITRNNLCRCDISQSFEVLCEQSAVKFNVDLRQCEKSPGRLVSDSVKCHVSPTLDNKDFFAVDISETIRSVLELTVVKSVKYSIDENTSDDEHPVECDTDTDSHLASGSGGTSDKPSNVFKLMMSKRSKCPQTVPELNKKDQLHNSFVREHASGMKFPGDMEQSVINYNVRLITNCLWYMDGRKQLLKDRKESSKKITEALDEWRYVALVLDRILLWVYIIISLVTAVVMFLKAPALYDTRTPLTATTAPVTIVNITSRP